MASLLAMLWGTAPAKQESRLDKGILLITTSKCVRMIPHLSGRMARALIPTLASLNTVSLEQLSTILHFTSMIRATTLVRREVTGWIYTLADGKLNQFQILPTVTVPAL